MTKFYYLYMTESSFLYCAEEQVNPAPPTPSIHKAHFIWAGEKISGIMYNLWKEIIIIAM